MKAAKKKLKEPTRRDGRKTMLVYMKPELIKAVKDAAEAGDEKAWQFVERAVKRGFRRAAESLNLPIAPMRLGILTQDITMLDDETQRVTSQDSNTLSN